MYSILYSKKAEKYIRKLESEDQKRIFSVLERARIRPEAHFERLVGEKLHKLRAGDYRIIADISHKEIRIFVVEVGRRRNIYK